MRRRKRLHLYVANLPCGHRVWHNHAAMTGWCARCRRHFSFPRWTKLEADTEALRAKENLASLLMVRLRLAQQLREDDFVDATSFQLLRSADDMVMKLEMQLDELLELNEEEGGGVE